MQYRSFARVASAALLAALVAASAPTPRFASRAVSAAAVTITVFKDPNCGCCRSWVEHLRKHGFDVIARDTSGMDRVKSTAAVPARLQSCHTAFVNGYVIEGHVPAADIQRLLSEKPKVAGLAVP